MLRDLFSGICRVRTDCGESWRERQETRIEDGDGRRKVDCERLTQVKFLSDHSSLIIHCSYVIMVIILSLVLCISEDICMPCVSLYVK